MSEDFERFERAFHRMSIEQVLENRRAIIGPANMPTTRQGDLAKEALSELKRGQIPTPTQLHALEMVVRLMRPSILSINRELGDLPAESAELGDWDSFRAVVRKSLYSIGRIDDAQEQGVGTGFLVSRSILVTNIHVVDDLSGGIRKLEQGQAQVRFKREYRSTPEEAPVNILRVLALHDTLDLALLEIQPVTLDDDRQPLANSGRIVNKGDAVVVIGYPQNDTQRNPLFVPTLFDGRFGVKRAAPGEVISKRGASFFHDCSTLGGNSGSPVICMKSGEVVGVHRAGNFMLRNESVGGAELLAFVGEHL